MFTQDILLMLTLSLTIVSEIELSSVEDSNDDACRIFFRVSALATKRSDIVTINATELHT